MSKYVYSLHDYHAVKNAVIKLDGITVLSGENGCGKSTLSKWLYYLVNGANRFDVYIYNTFIREIQERISRMNIARRDIDLHLRNDNANRAFFQEGEKKLSVLYDYESHENIEDAKAIFVSVITRFINILSDYLKKNPSPKIKERMLSFLDIDTLDDAFLEESLSLYVDRQISEINKLYDKCLADMDRRNKDLFFEHLRYTYHLVDNQPVNIQLEEDEVKLFKKSQAGNLYNLKRAIYVDTPMAVSEDFVLNNIFWDNLQSMMMEPLKEEPLSDAALKIEHRIRKLIKGHVKVTKDFFNEEELHYLREDGLDIKLVDVATGFKAFSYIQLLLDNGYLDDNTLLMIDEPEAHLHPQWIVEFAHILVLLNKELGVKILLASHNPDMVAAIQAISEKEGREDMTHFYIAEPSEKPYRYEYRDLGNNVEDIFKSFNIAYERIEQYGGTGI